VGRFLLHSGVNRIDTLILTSADKDHLSGAEYILQNFDVGRIFTNGDKLGGGLWGVIRNKNITWNDLTDTDSVSLGGDTRLDVLKPVPDFVISDSSRPRPLAIRVAFRDVSVLTGESLDDGSVLSSLSEWHGEKLMSSVLYLRSIEVAGDFLSFLRAVSPRVLITGESVPLPADKDHDMREAIKDISIFDTSADGEISLETDGSGMSVDTYTGEKKFNLK
jgi:beta-lactamase superfamily II metal-dependent hydrolase